LFCALLIGASLIGPLSGTPLPVSASPDVDKTFVVDAPYDEVSSGATDGFCATPIGGGCTLREALKEANANSGGTTTIHFALYGNVSLNLTLGALLVAGNQITIDGDGANFYINGAGNPANTDVFSIQGNNNILQNLTIRNSRRDGIFVGYIGIDGYGNNNSIANVTLYGSIRNGIYIHRSSNNSVTSSTIGFYLSATPFKYCDTSPFNGANGIVIDGNSQNTVLSDNWIECNGTNGVYVDQSNATQILNNRIGIESSILYGSGVGNGNNGVKDYLSSNTLLDGNIISGNQWDGVWLQGSTSATLVRNYIGTKFGGNAQLSNLYNGVYLSDQAANNTIGSSSDPNLGNTISGNALSGIALDSGAHDNLVDGNYIGVANVIDRGMLIFPNGYAGVAIVGGAHDNNIGSSNESIIQIIARNQREGIYIAGANSNHVHTSNFVGILGSSFLPGGNGREGIRIIDAANTLIEGLYAYNGLAGIAIEGDSATGNRIVPEHVGGNGGLPIDIGNDGATPNGSHGTTGPNHWLPYPVITGSSGNTISGTTCNNCEVFIYRALANPAAKGGGGAKPKLAMANSSGAWVYTLPFGQTGSDLSLVACTGGLGGDCSEMSPRPVIYVPSVKK
jgi:parallel beta-helix repeat protein